MKTKLALYRETFYDVGAVKYAAGQHYPLTEETERHIAGGVAELVDIDIDAEKAQKLALKAREASDRAAAAAANAESLAAAAVEAEKLAADAEAALAASAPAVPATEAATESTETPPV